MGACHPDDLPEGYHADARRQSLARSAGGDVEGCPRASAWSGLRQVDGMALAGAAMCNGRRGGVTRADAGRRSRSSAGAPP